MSSLQIYFCAVMGRAEEGECRWMELYQFFFALCIGIQHSSVIFFCILSISFSDDDDWFLWFVMPSRSRFFFIIFRFAFFYLSLSISFAIRKEEDLCALPKAKFFYDFLCVCRKNNDECNEIQEIKLFELLAMEKDVLFSLRYSVTDEYIFKIGCVVTLVLREAMVCHW
jgi:hypothetical protein